MWICPKCGREFKRTNQDHYCGKAPASIIRVHVGEEAVTHFHERLKGLEVHKSVIRLKFDQEMPLSLIADIAKWSFAVERL